MRSDLRKRRYRFERLEDRTLMAVSAVSPLVPATNLGGSDPVDHVVISEWSEIGPNKNFDVDLGDGDGESRERHCDSPDFRTGSMCNGPQVSSIVNTFEPKLQEGGHPEDAQSRFEESPQQRVIASVWRDFDDQRRYELGINDTKGHEFFVDSDDRCEGDAEPPRVFPAD